MTRPAQKIYWSTSLPAEILIPAGLQSVRLEALLTIGCSLLPFCYIAEMGDFWRRGMGLGGLVLGALRKKIGRGSGPYSQHHYFMW